MNKLILLIPIIAITGCASTDRYTKEQAELYQISMAQYQDYNCTQIKSEMNRLSNLIEQQEVSLQPPKETKNQYLETAITAFAIARGTSIPKEDKRGGTAVLSRFKSQYNGLDQLFIRKNCVIKNGE